MSFRRSQETLEGVQVVLEVVFEVVSQVLEDDTLICDAAPGVLKVERVVLEEYFSHVLVKIMNTF